MIEEFSWKYENGSLQNIFGLRNYVQAFIDAFYKVKIVQMVEAKKQFYTFLFFSPYVSLSSSIEHSIVSELCELLFYFWMKVDKLLYVLQKRIG